MCGCLDAPPGAPTDTPSSDASASLADDSSPTDCDQLFGAADDYHLCAAADDRCEFYTSASGDPCSQICDSLGAACIDAYDTDEPELCLEVNSDDCAGERGDIVCVCARPGVR